MVLFMIFRKNILQLVFCIGSSKNRINYSDGVKIINCRARNNHADGIHLNQGTSNATVYNCSSRNNGDDGLAIWPFDGGNARDLKNNVFCYNTIEFNWAGGGIAVNGGTGHRIYNNYIRETHRAAGIHLSTRFDGYKFKNTKEINFMNNVLIKTGSKKGYWSQILGVIDIVDDSIDDIIKNIIFTNTYIYDSQHDAICFKAACKNIVFNNLVIFGTGTDGQIGLYTSIPHRGAAIMQDSDVDSCKINNIALANIASNGTVIDSEKLGNYINLYNVSINGENDLGKTSYNYPKEPEIGNIDVYGPIPEPDPRINNKNIKLNPIVKCYGCEKPITGVRFKCLKCQDFDYCENCENKDHGKYGHPLLKINKPEICPLSISIKS